VLLNTIGNTPLIKIDFISKELGCEVFAKCEFFNPGGSIKDRAAKFMIEDALKQGYTKFVEPTSGNTGIGLALICAQKKLDLTIVMPKSMSLERRETIKHFGANLILTDENLGMIGAINRAKELEKEGFFMLNQFENINNKLAHFKTTAPEILKELPNIDIFITGIGTGGTISGVGEYLKSKTEIKIYGVEPSESAVINGKNAGAHKIEGIGAGFIPKLLNLDILDKTIEVSSKDAIAQAKKLAKEGFFVGISSGANIAAIYNLANQKSLKGKKIVTIFADTAARYLSTELFKN
jgi:cysteine synthase A